jgi:hypothetical protein
MKNKPKEQHRIYVKFINMVFVLGILLSILLVVYAAFKIYYPSANVSSTFYINSMLCGGVFTILFSLGFKKLNNYIKINLSVLFITIGITVYGLEIYLKFFQKKTSSPEIIAKQLGIPYDTRTKLEILEYLRDSGIEVYPNPGPMRLQTDSGKIIFNFGGISNITTIFPNESGYYPIIENDEHGFNNPKGLYLKEKVDIMLIGDSFTSGFSVRSNETISSVLRQLGFSTINIGRAGNGPLKEFASLKEYAEPLKPKIVLWQYYMNDLAELEREMESPILKKYLYEDEYSQKLISQQKEIDNVLINYVQVEWKKEMDKKVERKNKMSISIKDKESELGTPIIIEILKLSKLREMINLVPVPTSTPTGTPSLNFRDILQKSKQLVSGWGGKMYFVYLPDIERYSAGKKNPDINFVMQTVTELGIPIINIHKEMFLSHPDPLSFFPFRKHDHYNAEGYKLIAEIVAKRLETDNYTSIKAKK